MSRSRPADAAPLEAAGLRRTFRAPDGADARVVAVDDVSLTVARGSVTAITGPSGSGKSTLLQILAGLDRPDAGTVHVDGVDITTLRDGSLSRLRRRSIGFVFQSFNLIPTLDARANIALPLELDGRRVDRGALEDLAASLGIGDRLGHLPGQLSGGQQQRVAIARALLSEPAVVLADEPTGALDPEAAEHLWERFATTARERGQTVVLVTHDAALAARADRVLTMRDARLSAHAASTAVDAAAVLERV